MPALPLPHRALRAARSLHVRNLPPRLAALARRVLPPRLSSRAAQPDPSAAAPPHSLLARQSYGTVAIPTVYSGLDRGPTPGTVVGIVLGSVVGFILIVWLLQSLTQGGGGGGGGGNNARDLGEEEIVVRDRRDNRPRSRSPRSRRSRRSSRPVRQISRSPRGGRIIVEERRTSMPPPAPRSVIVEERVERRVDGDDIVEVIEEHSDLGPPRRQRPRRSGGYRSVDPELFAGGDYPQHPIYPGGRR